MTQDLRPTFPTQGPKSRSRKNRDQNPRCKVQDLRSKDQGPRTKILDLRFKIQGLRPKNNIQDPISNFQGQGSRSKIQEPMCSTIQELKPNYPGSKLTLKPHDPRSTFQDPRPKAQVHKFQKPICHDPKSIHLIQAPRYEIQEPRPQIQLHGPRSKVQNPRRNIQEPRPQIKVEDSKSKAQDQTSKIQDLRPGPRSKIARQISNIQDTRDN